MGVYTHGGLSDKVLRRIAESHFCNLQDWIWLSTCCKDLRHAVLTKRLVRVGIHT